MFKPQSVLMMAILALAWAGPVRAAAPAPELVPSATPAAETEPPDDLRVLRLTDTQRRILDQVFQRHAFESPPPPPGSAPFGVMVEPTVPGGLYRLGPAGDLPVHVRVSVGFVGAPAKVALRYYAEDFYGRKAAEGTLPPVFTDATGVSSIDLVLKDLTVAGYYHVLVTGSSEERLAVGSCGLVVVQPTPVPGLMDQKSPFGITAPAGDLPENFEEICRRLGAVNVAADTTATLKSPPETGLARTAIVPLGIRAGGASADILALIPGVPEVLMSSHWRLGRNPAPPPDLVGEAFAKDAAAYRTAILDAIAKMRQPIEAAGMYLGSTPQAGKSPLALSLSMFDISVAATPDLLADVLSEGPVLAKANGVSLCLGASAQSPNLRSGAFQRSLDYGAQLARRMGVRHVMVGETGEDPAAFSPQQQAWKLVTRNVLALAGGAERVYISYGRGLGQPSPSAAAYAWMTHALQGLAYREEIWPEVPLLEGHLFTSPDRGAAVIWSWIGEDPANPDCGALVFENGTRLEAFDVAGVAIGIWKGERLIVPLGEAPVYITSVELKPEQFRDRLRSAKILGVDPVSVWIRSLAANEAGDRMTAHLWIQSHRPERQDVVAGLQPPPGWKMRQEKQGVGLAGGEARELVFDMVRETPAPEAKAGVPNSLSARAVSGPVEISIAVSLSEDWVRRTQQVWPTVTPERTIEVGYGLADWAGIDPVPLASDSGTAQVEVRTAWDAENFYFAAVVHRDREAFRVGRFASDGDAIVLAWGVGDRADDDFSNPARGAGLPSGAFRDTDHVIALTFTSSGAQAIRLHGPRMMLRDHVPGNLDAWYGPVEGAKVDIARDAKQKVTIYEAAIPLKALAGLRAERGRTVRFSFRIGDGNGPPLEWSRAAGVPDYLAGPGSFLPLSSVEGLPCQTLWTFTGPTPGEKTPDKK
jgi:hypothetical protein